VTSVSRSLVPSLGVGALEERREVGHHDALVPPLRDLLHFVPRLDLEEIAAAVAS